MTPLRSSPRELIVVVGPTASGKTDLAVRLAERIGGEIVTADSVQVYRRFDVGAVVSYTAGRVRATLDVGLVYALRRGADAYALRPYAGAIRRIIRSPRNIWQRKPWVMCARLLIGLISHRRTPNTLDCANLRPLSAISSDGANILVASWWL